MKTKYVYTKDKLEQTERALKLACEKLDDTFGTCPCDLLAWEPPFNCAEMCDSKTAKCWQKYFIEKAGKK
jgi:hypothetical protein